MHGLPRVNGEVSKDMKYIGFYQIVYHFAAVVNPCRSFFINHVKQQSLMILRP